MVPVLMADGTTYNVNNLLGKGDSNAKLNKSDKAGKGYKTVGLSLAPANTSGYEVCASRSPGCTKSCIFTSGHGAMRPVQQARIAKTRLFYSQRDTFYNMLVKELHNANKTAKKAGMILACRLNVFSDLQWEKIFPDLFTEFSDVQFYDYTKHAKRMGAFQRGEIPANYHLTFSRSETNDFDVSYLLLMPKVNITVVFQKELPAEYKGREVINGDETDLRFLDKQGVIVGLKAKGQGKKDKTGFIVSLPLVG